MFFAKDTMSPAGRQESGEVVGRGGDAAGS